MIDEKIFSHAVTIATAFVHNGDLRLQGSIREDARPFSVLEDLVPVVYAVLQRSRKEIETLEGA
jgi:hypothetical protein